MTDNVAVLEGFTREVIAESGVHTLCLLVKPDTDFDGCFRAWDMDEQEFILIRGWLFSIEDANDPCIGALAPGNDSSVDWLDVVRKA